MEKSVSVNELSIGYINQEIVRLVFHIFHLSANDLSLDSDV